ncbi:uncharacterized protein [Henckelia pumila]|uniref:uncharacterized protein n=1 Tax=Henckelia pumila TaxID=405737 RepID=UPI003C6E28CB
MGSERDVHDHEDQTPVLEGGHGFCIRTFLAREPSLNQSFDLFYCESEAGIPFKWEAQPGTPKEYCIYPQPHEQSTTPPLSPSPLMQSLKLRLPHHDETKGPTSKVESTFKKMVRKSIASNRDRFQSKERLRFGEVLMESVKDSSVNVSSSSSSSSSFSIPWKDRGLDASRDSGSCIRKSNGAAAGISLLQVDDEENKRPRQEKQPDAPKRPPPALHSSYRPPPRPRDDGGKLRDSAWTKKALFWIKGSRARRTKLTQKLDQEISFRCPENIENILDSVEEFDDSSLCRNMSKSSSSSESNENFEALKMKGASYFSCGSWKGIKRDSCVCSKQI